MIKESFIILQSSAANPFILGWRLGDGVQQNCCTPSASRKPKINRLRPIYFRLAAGGRGTATLLYPVRQPQTWNK